MSAFVFFDIGGVFLGEEGVLATAEELHLPLETYKNTVRPYLERASKGEISADTMIDLVCKEHSIPNTISNHVTFWAEHSLPIKEMHDLAKVIARHYQVGIITNNNLHSLEANFKCGLIPSLPYKVIVESSKIGITKPNPKIYLYAQKESGFLPEQIVFIDDRKSNLDIPQELGWQTVLFNKKKRNQTIKEIKKILHI